MDFSDILSLLGEVEYVDFRFTDMLGTWHHMTFCSSSIEEPTLQEGIYFDGSSIKGWKDIHESDMVLKPDPKSYFKDPFSPEVLSVLCDIFDPVSGLSYEPDPRSIAKKAESYLNTTGFATTAFFGPEPEFFIFDGVQFDHSKEHSFYKLTSDEFPSSSAKDAVFNHGHRPLPKGGYFPVAPLDSQESLRSMMIEALKEAGLHAEKHHHEVAPSQHELGYGFASLVKGADDLQIFKYVVKQVAHLNEKTATFLPKPIMDENGSGMHVHQSLWNGSEPLFFADNTYANLSEIALYYIGGVLKHAKAINAFTNPTTNSYKRLVPGFEAPVICAYSARNRSAACRVPSSLGAKAKRVEMRFPDPMANGYLAFTAMLMAGLDGIKNKIHPGSPSDVNLYKDIEEAKKHSSVAKSLEEALDCLEKDHDFLLQGNVFTKDMIESYCELKREEVALINKAPHPLEYRLYYSL